MLGAGDFRRVQAAVDVHERLALARELARRRVGEPGGMRQALRNLAISLDLLEILRARDEREVHRAALARLAGLDEPDVLTRGGELAEIFDRLIVGRELEVGAGPESEGRVGGGNSARLRRENDGRRERPDNEHARRRLHGYPRKRYQTTLPLAHERDGITRCHDAAKTTKNSRFNFAPIAIFASIEGVIRHCSPALLTTSRTTDCGRWLTVRNIRPRYSPIRPSMTSCVPENTSTDAITQPHPNAGPRSSSHSQTTSNEREKARPPR